MRDNYVLRHIPVTVIDSERVFFELDQPFIILDSVITYGPSVSPINNLLMTMTPNPVIPMVGYVDISEYLNVPGRYEYTNLATDEEPYQYLIVLIKVN